MQVLCAFCVFLVIREKKDVQVMSVSESKFISLYALRLYVQTAGDFGGKCGQMTGTIIHASGEFFEDVAAIAYLNRIGFAHLESFISMLYPRDQPRPFLK